MAGGVRLFTWSASPDVRSSGFKRYGHQINDVPNQLHLRCTNCGVVFPAMVMAPEELEKAEIEPKTYKCPVCANFDTYQKADLFYDLAG